jgi:pSer/pThr/pTyr-binding forkhead associated (FHA) protein
MKAYLVLVTAPDPAVNPVAPGAVNVPVAGHFWTLAPGNNVLGREPAPDVAIALPWISVSRRHAEIELFANSLWEITDHSRNGTYVNGQPLPKATLSPLNDGDRIRIGDAELVFCFHLDPTAAAPVSEDDVL